MSSPWDPNPVPVQTPDQPNHRGAPWEPNGTALNIPEAPPPPASPAEQWAYVDPSAYSDPFTAEPVYTSGPQAPSAAAPAPIGTIPVPRPPAGLWTPADPLEGFGTLLPPPPPVPASPAGSPADPLLASSYQPERGELKIKERRTWKTWELLIAVVLAAVVGMWFNGNAGSASGTSNSASGGGYKLPPASGSSSTTVPASSHAGTATTAAPSGGATTTTAAGASTSTTSASGASGSTPTTGAATVGPATVLIPETQQTGNWTSPAFTIAGGTWNIGWAYQCVPAPTGGPAFQIFVVNNGAAAGSTPAVTSAAASGNSVTPQTTAGSQQVIVQTTAACRWAVKVTGSSS